MECPECKQEFDEEIKIPRILTACGHTICETCLKTRYKKKNIICPQCSVTTIASNLSVLPSNLALIQLKQKKNTIENCSKHNKSIEAYCCTDKTLVCVICLLEDGHKSHELTTVPKAAKKCRDLIVNYAQIAAFNLEFIIKESKDIEEKQNNLMVSYNNLIKDFTVIFDILKKILIEKETQIKEKLKKILNDEVAALNNKNNLLQKHSQNIEKFKNESLLAENDNDVDFISSFPKREELAKAATTKLQPISKIDLFSSFSVETEVADLIKLIQNKFFPKSKAKPQKKPGKDSKPKVLAKPSNKTIPKPAFTHDWQNISAISRVQSDEDTLSMKSFDFNSLYKLHSTKVYTISGFSDKALTNTELFDSQTETWQLLNECISPRTQFSAIVYNTNIMILGGKQAGKRLATCEFFDFNTNNWSISQISLPKARSGFVALTISSIYYLDDIYLIGGNDGNVLRSFEIYNMNEWISLPSMNHKRDELAAVVGPDLNIYAIGGYNNEALVLDSAEVYLLETEIWEEIPNMLNPRRALSAVSLPDGIYVIGGYNGTTYLKDVEKYDHRNKIWVSLASMKYPRCTLSCVASGDCQFIYAIGGFNGNALNVVERYSVVENKWEEIGSLKFPRFMHCSVAVSE